MNTEEFALLRAQIKLFMPDYMQEFAEELKLREHPSELTLKKHDYICAWIEVFVASTAEDILRETVNKYSRYNIKQLKQAFEWTLEHFAELDLGGNNKWYGVSLDSLRLIAKGSWSKSTQNTLIAKYISDTTWFND